MWSLAERWCDFSPRVRLTAGVLMMGLLMVLSLYCCREPIDDTTPVALKAQWRKIMPLRVEPDATAFPPSKPFSVLDFDTADSRLVSWQPAGTGGELTLEVSWQSIPPLFIQLAERGRAVRGFSIVPEQPRLKMTLQLEAFADE